MKIKQAAKQVAMTESQIRYYERNQLVPKVNRDVNGDRDFQDSDLEWLKFISQMRSANVSIKVLQKYVSLFKEGQQTANDRLNLLSAELTKLDDKINLLSMARAALKVKVDHYDTHVITRERQL